MAVRGRSALVTAPFRQLCWPTTSGTSSRSNLEEASCRRFSTFAMIRFLYVTLPIAGMSASKARRYLLSFARIGLVSKTPERSLRTRTARYPAWSGRDCPDDRRPGRTANRQGPRRRLQETVVLAIWSDNGPTVLQVDDSQHEVTLNARIGSTLQYAQRHWSCFWCLFRCPELPKRA